MRRGYRLGDDGFRLLQRRQMDHALAKQQPVQLVEYAEHIECIRRDETLDVGQCTPEQRDRSAGQLPFLSGNGGRDE